MNRTLGLFQSIFGNKKQKEVSVDNNYLVASLNDRIMPLDRAEVYEDPLDEFLKEQNMGEVTGGGTMQFASGEIEFCDIEIKLNGEEVNESVINSIIEKLEQLGAPKGSTLLIEKLDEKRSFGKKEGLGLYLDGVNLSDEVYKNSDSGALAIEIRRLANITDNTLRYWQGNTETALYFYSDSYAQIHDAIKDFVKGHPECENCRIVRVA